MKFMFKKKEFFEKIFKQYKKNRRIPPVDLHTHTTWTDGRNTVFEMSSEAINKQITTLLFSEHTRASSGNWFSDFAKEVSLVRKKFKNKCLFLIGTEVKILNNRGDLDLSGKIKAMCDLVMASVHRFPGETGTINNTQGTFSKEEAILMEFELTKATIENSDADIIGHPFGMSLKRFKTTPSWDLFLKLIKKASSYDKAFEINFHYHNNHKQLLEACVENNTLISFGSNAHAIDEIGKISTIKS